MPVYNTGETVGIGDVVAVLFEVTNVVADSDRLNILARTSTRHHGMSDDVRYQFSAEKVQLVKAALAPAPEQEPAPELEPAPADQAAQTD